MTTPGEQAMSDAGGGRDAPVVYADIRIRFQRARLVAGVLLMITGAVMSVTSAAAVPIPLMAAGILAIDALIRLRGDRVPLWSFLVDAITISLIVAADGGALVPLSALLAYLLVGTILLVPQPGTIWTIGAAAATFSVSSLGASPVAATGTSTATAITIWFQVAILFTAAGLLLLDGAENIRVARGRQQGALDAERRASEMKTQFVSMVSHELRTPLTNISGFAATLGEAWRTLEPPEIDEFLGIIQTEADHLGNLVDDVLAIPRLETGKLLVDITDFNLRPLAFRIANLIFPAGGEKDASVQVAGNVVVRADPNRVEQILRNLLDNARKYGGRRVGIESFPRGESHVIVVADNGHGVPEDDRDRIFEQFEQVSRGDSRTDTGVGLGLTITKRLIEAMGGEIWYEPGFPVGARFCFSLPAGEPVESVSPTPDDRVTV